MPGTKAYMVTYGTQELSFELERRARKTVAIEVHPDQSVKVKAPARIALDDILTLVEKRGKWILKQQRTFAQLPPPLPPREYVSGESYRYLGRQVRLKVVPALRGRVRLYQGYLEVHTPHPECPARTRALLECWYRLQAERVFKERMTCCLMQVAPYGITHSGVFELRRMRKRWGSCSPQGKLLLNTLLVAANKGAIDYVIIHELCHLVHHNHSKAFYALQERCLPDWRERKRSLEEQVLIL